MDFHDLDIDHTYRKVYDYEGGSVKQFADGTVEQDVILYHLSLACQHCDSPACVQVCPTAAMHRNRDNEFGLVTVDTEKCIGCGFCHMACPYNACKVNKEKGYSVKCDGCIERVRIGKQTICVEACPLRALDFGPIDDLRQKYEDFGPIAPMPVNSYTEPNIVIKPCSGVQKPGSTLGFVANPMEVR